MGGVNRRCVLGMIVMMRIRIRIVMMSMIVKMVANEVGMMY